MTNNIALLTFMAAIFATGFVDLIIKRRKNRAAMRFSNDFKENLAVYIESHGKDCDTYEWLLRKSTKMQIQMGGFGVAASFKPPLVNGYYPNYPVILNMIPALHRAFCNEYSTNNIIQAYVLGLLESISRYEGHLEDSNDSISSNLKNPFSWFSSGMQSLLSVPIKILELFGVLGHSFVSRLTSSLAFRFVSSVIAMISFVSSVVGLVTGWDPFLVLIHSSQFISGISIHVAGAAK